MAEKKPGDDERARVNPAARRDRPGEEHEDLAAEEKETGREPVRGYQETELDPRHDGGIGS